MDLFIAWYWVEDDWKVIVVQSATSSGPLLSARDKYLWVFKFYCGMLHESAHGQTTVFGHVGQLCGELELWSWPYKHYDSTHRPLLPVEYSSGIGSPWWDYDVSKRRTLCNNVDKPRRSLFCSISLSRCIRFERKYILPISIWIGDPRCFGKIVHLPSECECFKVRCGKRACRGPAKPRVTFKWTMRSAIARDQGQPIYPRLV